MKCGAKVNLAEKVVTEVPFPTEIKSGGLSGRRLFADAIVFGINIGENTKLELTSGRTNFVTSSSFRRVKLERCKLRKLFPDNKPTLQEIQNRIREIGSSCAAEDALHLRTQFIDQPKGDHFWVIVEPIPVSMDSLPGIFYLCSNGGGLWIEILPVGTEVCWSLDTEIVYIPK